MGFKQLALFVVMVMLVSILMAFAFDYITVFMTFDDVRIQTYIGGFYVAGMAADATALASGPGYTGDLYKDEDIMEAFEEFSISSFGNMATKHPEIKDLGNKRHMKFDINKMTLQSIVTSCEILNVGGVKGVAVTVEYRVDPKLNMLLHDEFPLRFPYYRLPLTRKFRLLGQ